MAENLTKIWNERIIVHWGNCSVGWEENCHIHLLNFFVRKVMPWLGEVVATGCIKNSALNILLVFSQSIWEWSSCEANESHFGYCLQLVFKQYPVINAVLGFGIN